MDFADQNYHYKSVAIQIHHDDGLAPVHTAGVRNRNLCEAVTRGYLRARVRVCDILNVIKFNFIKLNVWLTAPTAIK